MDLKKKITIAAVAAGMILLAVFVGIQIYKFGYENGFDSGHAGWYNKGYLEGREDGYKSGLDAGFEQAKAELSADFTSDASETEEQRTSEQQAESGDETVPAEYSFVLNKNSKRFHSPDCKSTLNMKEENKEYYTGTREEMIQKGYKPCGSCKP